MPLLEGIPAYIYSGLWIFKTYRKLDKIFPNLKIKLALFITDFPPAALITIDNGDFEVQALENVKTLEDLEKVECDSYLMAKLEAFTGGAEGIMRGINDKSVIVKGSEVLNILGKIAGGL